MACFPPPTDFCELTNWFLQVKDDFRKEIFAISAWILWNRTNALHFCRLVQPIANISALAGNLLQDFLVAQDVESMITLPFDVQTLAPSRCGSYKLNFDAAVFNDSNIARIEIIARDWRGKVIVALLQSISVSHLVADMEAQACRRAVHFAVEIGLRRVVFEGDSALVINVITQGGAKFSTYGNIIDDIRCIVVDFQFVKFKYVIVLLMF